MQNRALFKAPDRANQCQIFLSAASESLYLPHFPIFLVFKRHGNRPKYFRRTNINTGRRSLLLYGSSPHKGPMMRCHAGANPNQPPPPRPRLQTRSCSGRRASFCPQTSLSTAHLPVKTFVPWLISVSAPPSHPRVDLVFPTNPSTQRR